MYDPAIPLLGIHTEETRRERDTSTPMFIAALFIIARTWKQPRCPSTDEWIRKLWYIYTWTIKKAECRRTDAFELWCWRRLLRVSWTTRRPNQLFLKGINPEYSLERLLLKLKLRYFGHLMGRANSLEKTLMLGKVEGKRRGW